MLTHERAILEFESRFGQAASLLVRAPGRVNLIGEHTDYNDGFVLPVAIDRAVWIAMRPAGGKEVVIHSLELADTVEFSVDDLRHVDRSWAEYVKGVAWALNEAGFALKGWHGVIGSDVPIGAGLSSSAAIELASARAFAAASDFSWEPVEMARIAQQAETEWVGVSCGIMDQMSAAVGHAGHGLLMDCRSLEMELVPLPAGTVLLVLDTATRRDLAESAYNERRRQCEAAARALGVPALRDLTEVGFEREIQTVDPVLLRRARHVVTENARTLEAAEAMHRGDASRLGWLLNASHESLRDDFEVSSPELDHIVEAARSQKSCHGARMTGAGFGGCAVAIVRAHSVGEFSEAVAADYRVATGLQAAVHICKASDGATLDEV